MSKGYILVDSVPETCLGCHYHMMGNFCLLTDDQYDPGDRREVDCDYKTEKPAWCPIKELPKFQEPIENSDIVPFRREHEMMNLGWNKCLERILGKIWTIN